MDFYLALDSKVTTSKRRAYTIMNLLGDFGGFNDAIIFIIGTFLSAYSARMFESSIAT